MQSRASSWRVRARAASPNTSPKPRGGHSENQAGQKTWAEQASESDTSGTSEIRSQDNEDEKEQEYMSASKTRRTKQQAHQQKADAIDQVPQVMHKGHNVPIAHRLCRKPPQRD